MDSLLGEVDSNFQYAGTGESRHPAFVLHDCLGPVGACPGAAGFLCRRGPRWWPLIGANATRLWGMSAGDAPDVFKIGRRQF